MLPSTSLDRPGESDSGLCCGELAQDVLEQGHDLGFGVWLDLLDLLRNLVALGHGVLQPLHGRDEYTVHVTAELVRAFPDPILPSELLDHLGYLLDRLLRRRLLPLEGVLELLHHLVVDYDELEYGTHSHTSSMSARGLHASEVHGLGGSLRTVRGSRGW